MTTLNAFTVVRMARRHPAGSAQNFRQSVRGFGRNMQNNKEAGREIRRQAGDDLAESFYSAADAPITMMSREGNISMSTGCRGEMPCAKLTFGAVPLCDSGVCYRCAVFFLASVMEGASRYSSRDAEQRLLTSART